MTFQLAAGVFLQGYYPATSLNYFMLSDHSRAPLSFSYEKYEKSVQMANGDTRKFVISSKRSLSVSWTNLPTSAVATVDNGAGAKDLKLFYDNNYNNTITGYIFSDSSSVVVGTAASTGLVISSTDAGKVTTMPSASPTNSTSISFYIDSFSTTINKRYSGSGTALTGKYDLWDVSLTLKEV